MQKNWPRLNASWRMPSTTVDKAAWWDFLLAWWNSGSCGAFDLTSLWSLDTAIVADMTVVFGLIGRVHRYPDSMGYEAEFKAVVRAWRPELED